MCDTGPGVRGNYDKSAPLNRFGLCAFGNTGGTRALGVKCDGF